MKKCPICKSINLESQIGGLTGMYRCDDCGYIGVLVIEEDDNSGN